MSVGHNVLREVKVLREELHTGISQSVVEVAPRVKQNPHSLPAVGLLHVSARAQRLEQLDHLQSADGDVHSVLVLTNHVGLVDVVLHHENSIYAITTKLPNSHPQRAGDKPSKCPFYQRAFLNKF